MAVLNSVRLKEGPNTAGSSYWEGFVLMLEWKRELSITNCTAVI